MSSQHVWMCDRCGMKESKATMPNGWMTVMMVTLQADLCAQCLAEFRELVTKFMSEKRR